jgi:thiamine transport system substrate-binding protein
MLICIKKYTLIGLISLIFLAACGPLQPTSPTGSPQPGSATPLPPAESTQELSVMTHDSFAISEEVLNAFQNQYNVNVKFLKSGDTGTAVNKAILSKDAPLADVFYGVDNTFLSRALEENIFETYQSPVLSVIPDEFELDPQNRVLPVDFGDVCLNYDKAHFAQRDLPPPQNLEDLLKPEYTSLLVVENPATSSPGLAFLFATIGHFGEEGYLDYWEGLVKNDVKVVNDWEIAYRSEFSRWGGTRPIVVSYGSSPPFDVIFSEEPIEEPLTAAIVSDGSCFRQIEFVGILKGARNRTMAEKWIDFMLSPQFQADVPLQMFVFPVNPEAQLDDTFVKYLAIPENPASVSPDQIAKNREKWIQAWTEVVLR